MLEGIMAERQGFEPWVRHKPYNGLAIRRFRPLSHLSGEMLVDQEYIRGIEKIQELFLLK